MHRTTGLRARVALGFGATILTLALAPAVLAAVINGTSGPDTLVGTGEADLIRGYDGGDRIFGGDGNDELRGGRGNDQLFVQGGADYLYGARGRDVLIGGQAQDHFFGGPGDDVIYASGEGSLDQISCGSGYDVVFADLTDEPSSDCEVVIDPQYSAP